jgi:hypothetical protein
MEQTVVIMGLTGEVSGSVNVGVVKYESQGKHRGLIRTVELSSPVAQDDRDYALLIGFLLLTGWRLSVIEIEIDSLKPLLHSHPSQTQLGVILLPPIGFTNQDHCTQDCKTALPHPPPLEIATLGRAHVHRYTQPCDSSSPQTHKRKFHNGRARRCRAFG